jgi:alpha-galactosidase
MRADNLAEYPCGDMTLRYLRTEGDRGTIGLLLFPAAKTGELATPREALSGPHIETLPQAWQPMSAGELEPLVQLHVRGDAAGGGFSAGRTLRGSGSVQALRCEGHERTETDGTVRITTRFRHPRGLLVEHAVEFAPGALALRVGTEVRNAGAEPLTLDLLTSFAIGGLSPFAPRDEAERIRVHRFRSAWSAEGRHECRSLEELHLERSWSGHGVRGERFGQAGSLPVNGFFPCIGIEDRVAEVTWAAQLAQPGSWQIEIARRGDPLAISGGLADRELGHWCKTLAPGEAFSSPPALLTAAIGGMDAACARLVTERRRTRPAGPVPEESLPVVFNEWCTSWGNPTHDSLIALADRLRGTGVRYLVIDDGWAERPGPGFQQNGDWIVNRRAFPQGLGATAEAIRARGLIPGIWFEFEVVNPGSRAWEETTHQLRKDGQPLQVGNRRFWDFRDPWVHAYLAEKVIRLLREAGLGYLKVDYNDSIGIGCDGAESMGEGLRQHLAGVQRFFTRLRSELPDLVIENCSSGGHRLEPSMMALTAMSSFSDAHETPDIPVIAANLLRLVPAEQSQIWCVLHAQDSRQRLAYSLAATFLGRMCLSGEVHELSDEQWSFVRSGIAHYSRVAGSIRSGNWQVHGERGDSYQHLNGWQAAVVKDHSQGRALVVWHAFEACPARGRIAWPAGEGWSVADELADQPTGAAITGESLDWSLGRAWSGGVIELQRQ